MRLYYDLIHKDLTLAKALEVHGIFFSQDAEK